MLFRTLPVAPGCNKVSENEKTSGNRYNIRFRGPAGKQSGLPLPCFPEGLGTGSASHGTSFHVLETGNPFFDRRVGRKEV